MVFSPELVLIVSVGVVGVLHTIVPDHWVPIALIARQRGWSRRETAAAALQAGFGHVGSTLAIAAVIWFAGVAVAARFGHFIDTAASLALIAFGGWIAVGAWRDLRRGRHDHGHSHDFAFLGCGAAHHDHAHGGDHSHALDHDHDHHAHDHDHDHEPAFADDPLYAPTRGVAVLARHTHAHRHGGGAVHTHWHDHDAASAHAVTPELAAAPPLHEHKHKTTARTAMLLILGSSPMVEGIPAFFAAGKYGAGLIGAMAAVFATSTIVTYIALCVASTAGLQRLRLGAFERYGEVMSGAFIALVGVAFWLWPVL